MRRFFLITSASVLITLLFFPLSISDEGMWLMTQVGLFPYTELREHGLELTPDQLYNPNGPSVDDAIVLLPGGTGSFVSQEGLVITNHHIAFSAVQSVSSVKDDYLKNGFVARTKEDEISIPGNYSAQVVVSIKDVTDLALNGISDTISTADRQKTVQANIKEIEANARKEQPELSFQVADAFFGVKYFLYSSQVFRDVRLVYVPPYSIGNFGGEVDNWMWPRHTGDFSFMRVYVGPDGKPAAYAKENIPYHPPVSLPISLDGVKENSFAMVLGFPGRTYRYRTSIEVELAKNESLPLLMDLYKTRMDIIEDAGKNDRAIELKYAIVWRRMANAYKNYAGTLEGMHRADILHERKSREAEFLKFLQSKPELQKKYGTVLDDIASVYQQLISFNKKQTVLNQIQAGSDLLRLASKINATVAAAVSTGAEGKSSDRLDEATVNQLSESIRSTYKDMDVRTDQWLLASMLLKATELPKEQRIEAVDLLLDGKMGNEKVERIHEELEDIYNDSRLTSEPKALELLKKNVKEILNDPFVRFAGTFAKDNDEVTTRTNRFNTEIARSRARLLEAWMQWKGENIPPDANRTLRITYGEVKPYEPRDAVSYDFQTSLTGIMEKQSNEDPFIVEPKLRQLWEAKDFGRYTDPRLKDVPVAFLANLDITGGNSGSPVINGKGELIGVSFDGNWEAVVGDYLYQEPLNRSINVDSRYVLFLLDKYSNAENILRELVIRDMAAK